MEKVSKITLKEDEKEYLESLVRSGTSPPRMIQRAKILLLLDIGVPVTVISDTAGINREKVKYCLKKYNEGGAKFALNDARKQSRATCLSNEERDWILNIACQRGENLRLTDDVNNYRRLKTYINEKAEEAGYARLSNISYSNVIAILKKAGIQSRNLRHPMYFISH